MRFEGRVKVNSVQNVSYQFLEKDAGSDPYLATELACHGFRQLTNIAIIAALADSIGVFTMLLKDVTHFAAHQAESFQVESGQPNLDGAWIVESDIRLEIDVQPLCEWFQPPDSLRSVEKRRRTRNQ